jgi:exonuclease III
MNMAQNPLVDDGGADDDLPEEDVICPFPQISISAINCNSLNMSNTGKSQHLRKIYGIVRLKTDIILLSDIRLCNKAGIADVKSLEQTLKINPYCSYKLIHHSRKKSRGVAILYKYDLPFTVLSEERDASDNVLIIKARIHEQTVILCSIYGPNGTDELFYRFIAEKLDTMGDYPIVIGGDWNTCYCTLAIPNNIDVVNMINLPNPPNSKSLSKLCQKYKLVDPFRILWPERKDYSYVPRDVTKTNRSRLEFFVVSKGISHLVKKCNILPNTQSRLFDHKAVTLEFTESKPPVCIPTISPRINNDPDINFIVEISPLEMYITYCNEYDENRKSELLRNLGRCRAILRKAGPDPIFAGGGGDYINADIDKRNRSLTEFRDILATFELAFLQNSQLNVDNDDFLELLINNIRNDVIGYQAFILQMQKKAKRDLEIKLDKLKKARDCALRLRQNK